MFNSDFYPTPRKLALKVAAGIAGKERILEPSAGKGDLAKFLHESYSRYSKVDVIEKDPQLLSILREEDSFRVVDTDFLSFYPDAPYSYIVMNPPFSNGLEHLEHAFEISSGTEIRCLLNYDTIHGSTKRAELWR